MIIDHPFASLPQLKLNLFNLLEEFCKSTQLFFSARVLIS